MKTLPLSKSILVFFCIAIISTGSLLSGCGGATENFVAADLLSKLPANWPLAVVLPSPRASLDRLGAIPLPEDDQKQLEQEYTTLLRDIFGDAFVGDAKNMTELIALYGIDDSRPFGAAAGVAEEFLFAAYLPLNAPETFLASPLATQSEPFTISAGGTTLNGGVKADPGLWWFLIEDYAVVASDPVAAQRVADAWVTETPLTWLAREAELGAEADVVALLRMQGIALPGTFKSEAYELAAESFSQTMGFFTMDMDEHEARAVMLARKSDTSGTVPPPLRLTRVIGEDALVTFGLRLGEEFAQAIEAIAKDAGKELPPEVLRYYELAGAMLGEEIAFGMALGSGFMPSATLAVDLQDPASLDALIGLTGMPVQEAGEHKGIAIKAIGDSMMPMFSACFALADSTLLAATSQPELTSMLDALDRRADSDAPNRFFLSIDFGGFVANPMLQGWMPQGSFFPGQDPMADMQRQAMKQLENMPPYTLRVNETKDLLEGTLSGGMIDMDEFDLAGLSGGQGSAHAAPGLAWLENSRTSTQQATSQNNLKQMGLVFKMYANESAGMFYPEYAPEAGTLMAATTQIYPEYLSDPSVLCNPGAEDAGSWQDRVNENAESAIGDHHYIYLAYAVRSEEDIDALAKAYTAAVEEGAVPTADVEHEGRTLYRLREGLERFLTEGADSPSAIADLESTIPVLLERQGAWEDDSVSVLFMDGHVERVQKGTFPNTDTFWQAIERMENVLEK